MRTERHRLWMSATHPAARSTHHATLADSHGSSTSTRWCGTRSQSAAVGFAVPTSRPRYSVIESIATISAPVRSAHSSAREDLPDPVGPVRTVAARNASGAGTEIPHNFWARPVGGFTLSADARGLEWTRPDSGGPTVPLPDDAVAAYHDLLTDALAADSQAELERQT